MMTKYIDLIIAPLARKILIWIQESAERIVLSIIVLIALLASGIMFSKWLTFGKLFRLFNQSYAGVLFISSIYNVYLLWLAIVGIIWVFVSLRKKEREARLIEVKFRKNSRPSDYFAVPRNSDWSLIQDDDVLGNVLSVTNSGLIGYLIRGAEWRNYRLSFKTKILSNNFTFAVRTTNQNNGVFFQCGDKHICPHLIVNGIFIRHFNDDSLPIKIPTEKWIPVSALVEGDKITIIIDGTQREFIIPKGPWFIKKENLTSVLEYKVVKQGSEEALRMNDYIKNNGGIVADEDSIDDIAKKLSANAAKVSLNNYHVFNFEYDRGTIGFREASPEHALFKDIKIEILDKI